MPLTPAQRQAIRAARDAQTRRLVALEDAEARKGPTPESRECPHCRETFAPVVHNQMYCSDQHRRAAQVASGDRRYQERMRKRRLRLQARSGATA